MNKREFLGVGWKFPLQVNARGGIAISRYEQSIEESIYMILSTARNERLMMPEFGAGIHDVVFAPNNPAMITLVVDGTRRALVAYEPRIDVLNVDAETNENEKNLLIIRINYRVRANNTVENIVYPFYITEGR
jgi:phage baseplate assembly protein W